MLRQRRVGANALQAGNKQLKVLVGLADRLFHVLENLPASLFVGRNQPQVVHVVARDEAQRVDLVCKQDVVLAGIRQALQDTLTVILKHLPSRLRAGGGRR